MPRVYFSGKALALALLAPMLAIIAIFFLVPSAQGLWYSVSRSVDVFTGRKIFVGLENFSILLTDPLYHQAIITTVIFSSLVVFFSVSLGLILAAMANRVLWRARKIYQSLLMWPYVVAPAVAATLWLLMFNPLVGYFAFVLKQAGIDWNYHVYGGQAMTLVVAAATWRQISYNFLFFLAALQAVPPSLIEAAALDGAGPVRRLSSIVLPLIAPTTFFLVVVNLVYAFFDTFALIDTMTSGGPYQATTTLVYKVYSDGFVGLNYGSSAAQSIILMVIVGILTVVQFRYIGKRVHYG
ncbi:MAG: sn-glycerol-3-phosphate ABC transporter permease UgpA [Pseudomonadota bacterium]